MKPKYYFKYDFPNEKLNKKFIKDYIDNDFTQKQIYEKYGKYRTIGNWDDFESGFIFRLNVIQKDHPEFTVTHLVLYDGIFIKTLSLPNIGCKEKDLLEYVKTHTDDLKYIENMDLDKFSVVRFKNKTTYKASYKVV